MIAHLTTAPQSHVLHVERLSSFTLMLNRAILATQPIVEKLTEAASETAAVAWATKGLETAWLMALDMPSPTWSAPMLCRKSVGSTMGAWPSVESQAFHTTCIQMSEVSARVPDIRARGYEVGMSL